MQNWLAISLLIVALIFVSVGFCGPLYDKSDTSQDTDEDDTIPESFSPHPDVKGKVICYLTEYDEAPDDNQGPPSADERALLQEDFRVARTGGGGGRAGGGGGRAGGGGGRAGGSPRGGGGRRGGSPRGGRRGRRGGRGRHGFWPWRRWPRRYYGRPWRSWWWRSYPEVVYTYPLSYYTPVWTPPVQRFSIRIGPKADNNPFAGRGSEFGYMVTQGSGTGCGASGARLDLYYGQTYEFDIYTSRDCVTGQSHHEPFFFTTDKNGGSKLGELFDITPTVNGTIRVTITDNLPSQFYYQSTNSRNVGGYVFLH